MSEVATLNRDDHMNEWAYLLLAALANTLLQFILNQNKAMRSDRNLLVITFVGSFFIAWGIDVIQRGLEVLTIIHILKVCLGCWLMFATTTAAKNYMKNGLSKKQFTADASRDLAGFILMGLIIHVLS